MNSRKSLQADIRSKQIANEMTVEMCVKYFIRDKNMMTQKSVVIIDAIQNFCQDQIMHLTSEFIWIPDLTVL